MMGMMTMTTRSWHEAVKLNGDNINMWSQNAYLWGRRSKDFFDININY